MHWLRADRLPHIWCSGCSNGTILNCTMAAVDTMGWNPDRTVVVSGIGCSSRAAGYVGADSLHTTHGRALAFATGVKLADPSLNVVVFTGDGDLAAIGGNHFIHACRRNIDLTVVCMNNLIYGMTGGQGSPTTPRRRALVHDPVRRGGAGVRPRGARRRGRRELRRPLDLGTTSARLEKAVKAGLETPGLSFVEVRAACPTNYGRKNRIREATDQSEQFRTKSMLKAKYDRLVAEGKPVPPDAIVVGEFVRRANPAMGVAP